MAQIIITVDDSEDSPLSDYGVYVGDIFLAGDGDRAKTRRWT